MPFIIFVGLACKPLYNHTSFITVLFHKNAFSRWGLFLLWKTKKKKNSVFLFILNGRLPQCVTYLHHLKWKSSNIIVLFLDAQGLSLWTSTIVRTILVGTPKLCDLQVLQDAKISMFTVKSFVLLLFLNFKTFLLHGMIMMIPSSGKPITHVC